MKIAIIEILVFLIFAFLCVAANFVRKFAIETRNAFATRLDAIHALLEDADGHAIVQNGYLSGIKNEFSQYRSEFTLTFDSDFRKKVMAIMEAGERPENMMRKVDESGNTSWLPIDHGY